MILSNFLFRARQYATENRVKLIRALVIAVGALIVAALIYYGIEQWQRGRFERRVNALEAKERAASARALLLESEAEALKSEIKTKETELKRLESHAARADAELWRAKNIVQPLKETYEEARDRPDVNPDTTCADACKELAAIGHPCR